MGKISEQDQEVIRVRERIVVEYQALRTRIDLDQRCLLNMVLYSMGDNENCIYDCGQYIEFYINRIMRVAREMYMIERYARLFDEVFELKD